MKIPHRVLVLGLGVSGRSVANFCAARGARVVAADERSAQELSGLDELQSDIEIAAGQAFPDPGKFDLVVPSPGVPPERYARALETETEVWGDIELASRFLEVPIAAVTGTNGKTTTVSLVETMLRGAGLRARAAGNVGSPALSLVGEALDVAILEVSSFQLETCLTFHPHVAAILNLTPDHLDRHGDFARYREAKRRILKNQDADDIAVLNASDPAMQCLAKSVRGHTLWFGGHEPREAGVWLDSGSLVLQRGDTSQRFSLDDFALAGEHNRENLAAALAMTTALGADPSQALAAVRHFRGLPHRCEILPSRDGIRWINDSKATNPGAAARSLCGFDGPVIWIAGGRRKGLDFGPLADIAARRARRILLIGESAEELEQLLRDRVPTERCASLEEAVNEAGRSAGPGDVVLLAPACASQDQFASFEERGDRFRAAVERRSATRSEP
jgi:UDP-N-acetylmuramoylalanine--D-glutamate ligase